MAASVDFIPIKQLRQEFHPVFLATLRKGVEGLFRSTDGLSSDPAPFDKTPPAPPGGWSPARREVTWT